MNKLRRLRKEKNLKQSDMATKLGISQSTYSIIERNEYDKDKNKNEYLDILERISKILDCSVVELLKEEDKEVEQISFSEGQIVIDVKGKIDKKLMAMQLINVGVQLLNEA